MIPEYEKPKNEVVVTSSTQPIYPLTRSPTESVTALIAGIGEQAKQVWEDTMIPKNKPSYRTTLPRKNQRW